MTTLLSHIAEITTKVAQEPRVAGGVGAATTVVGSFFNLFPDALLAKVATMSGICLTFLLIIIHGIKLYRMLRYGNQG